MIFSFFFFLKLLLCQVLRPDIPVNGEGSFVKLEKFNKRLVKRKGKNNKMTNDG